MASDQNDGGAAHFVAAKNVAQHVQAERYAAGAEKGDLGVVAHRRLPRSKN
jgi:hypothetical protein